MGIRNFLSERASLPPIVEVAVAGIAGLERVRVKRISTADAMAMSDGAEFTLRLIAATVVDEEGGQVFAGEKAVEAIKALDWQLVAALTDAVLSVNGQQRKVNAAATDAAKK